MSPGAPPLPEDEALERLLEHIRRTRGFDFTGYKRSTLQRRVSKRMQELGVESCGDYLDQLEASAGEFTQLFNTILINVSSFFRDPRVWEYVADHVIPEILAGKPQDAPIRVWSAGCATGEEPYTIAILLAEALGEAAYAERVKIFATDIDAEALDAARQAVYQPKQVETVPPELLARHFEPVNGSFNVNKELRRSVIFGRNDLVRDAPISRLDLLLCRNTLMYFNGETQANVLRRLHLALSDGGFLVLGKSETLLAFSEAFRPENLSLRIFRAVPRARLRDAAQLLAVPRLGLPEPAVTQNGRLRDALEVSPIAQLVVDRDGLVVLANSRLRTLFGIAPSDIGRPLQDLEISYRPVELRSLIEGAAEQQAPISRERMSWRTRDGGERHLELEVTALRDEGGEQLGTSVAFVDVTRFNEMRSELEQSKRELEAAYEELQSTVEELETTNEELQSSNEELETTNEELQSTVEELETTNEELQSSNEELETMNEELRIRTDELNRTNVLMESMLSSLGVAVAIVDREMRVQIWNDRAREMWGVDLREVLDQHLLNLDIGLPVELLRDPLRACISGVSTGEELSIDARDRRGRELLCHVRCAPLVGSQGHVDGAILLMEAT